MLHRGSSHSQTTYPIIGTPWGCICRTNRLNLRSRSSTAIVGTLNEFGFLRDIVITPRRGVVVAVLHVVAGPRDPPKHLDRGGLRHPLGDSPDSAGPALRSLQHLARARDPPPARLRVPLLASVSDPPGAHQTPILVPAGRVQRVPLGAPGPALPRRAPQ